MKRDKIFTRDPEGRVIAIGNWEARTSDNDAFIGLPLSDSGMRALRAGRANGKSDRQIYYDLQKNRKSLRPSLPIEDLTVQQLVKIVTDLLEEELESLQRMDKSDLIELVKRLAHLRKVQIGFDFDFEK